MTKGFPSKRHLNNAFSRRFESDKIRQPQDLKNNILRQRDDLAKQINEQQAKKEYRHHLDNVAHTENSAQIVKLNNLEEISQELQKAMKKANRNYNEALVNSIQMNSFGLVRLFVCSSIYPHVYAFL